MPVIAISRQFGCGGAWVGHAVAQRLKFRYADREILAEAARRLDVESHEVAPLEERVRSFWERFALSFAQGAVDTPFTPPVLPSVSEAELFAVERQIIASIAEHGDAVIVGRGAAHILADRADVIRVFLHAPLPGRIALAMEEYGFADADEAASVVRASDAQRARFVRQLTGRDWCDATVYDLCLDTERTGLERTVDVIAAMATHGRSATTLPVLTPRTPENRDAS